MSSDIYTVDEKELLPLRMTTLPAMLVYKHDVLKIAFHGSFGIEQCNMAIGIFEGRIRKK